MSNSIIHDLPKGDWVYSPEASNICAYSNVSKEYDYYLASLPDGDYATGILFSYAKNLYDLVAFIASHGETTPDVLVSIQDYIVWACRKILELIDESYEAALFHAPNSAAITQQEE